MILISRSEDKLKAAQERLKTAGDGKIDVKALDCTDSKQVDEYFQSLKAGSVNHLIATAGASAGCGNFTTDSFDNVMKQFNVKFGVQWSAAHAAAPILADGGSITFFSGNLFFCSFLSFENLIHSTQKGALSRRPGKGSSALAACNAALETLAKGIANDLGPRLRVNCVSPGLTRTEAFAAMPKEAQEKMFEGFGKAIPAGRAGEGDDIGHAVLFLLTSKFVTGTTLDVDGGAVVRA